MSSAFARLGRTAKACRHADRADRLRGASMPHNRMGWPCGPSVRLNAGSFNDQVHSIGPTLFLNFGGEDDEAKGGGDEGKAAIESGQQTS